jgi:hypothetical protein
VTGHGTHIAGIISSTSHGVAHSPNVLLHSIKVLDCAGSGTTSGLAAGLIWIQQHLLLPAVINLSLSMSGTDVVLEAILSALRTAGALIVTAAGNSASDACNFFPAGSPSVITVGSSSVPVHQGVTSEQVSSFSNYGSCVEMYAKKPLLLRITYLTCVLLVTHLENRSFHWHLEAPIPTKAGLVWQPQPLWELSYCACSRPTLGRMCLWLLNSSSMTLPLGYCPISLRTDCSMQEDL